MRLLLTTFNQLVEDFLSRPTHLLEIIAELPKVVGAVDACGYGLAESTLQLAVHPRWGNTHFLNTQSGD